MSKSILSSDESTATSREARKFISDNMILWVKDTVLKEILRHCKAANLPDSFIEHIYVTSDSSKVSIINDWEEDDNPLARYFEYGTTDHWIEPKSPDGVLAWPAQGGGGTHARSIYYKSGEKKKGKLYSKGHFVSGIQSHMAMSMGYDKGIIQLKQRIARELKIHQRRRGIT